jgi:hypothetical protein
LEFILKTNYPQYKTALAVVAAAVLLTACGKKSIIVNLNFVGDWPIAPMKQLLLLAP